VPLYCRQGSSDKVNRASVEPSGPGYVVTFAFGRRGGTLQTGTKTPEPVGYDEAKAIYDRLVREKTDKGYQPGDEGTAYARPPERVDEPAVLPQLLNPVDEADAETLSPAAASFAPATAAAARAGATAAAGTGPARGRRRAPTGRADAVAENAAVADRAYRDAQRLVAAATVDPGAVVMAKEQAKRVVAAFLAAAGWRATVRRAD